MALMACSADAGFSRRPDGRERDQEVSGLFCFLFFVFSPLLTGVQEREEIAVMWSLVVFVYRRVARLNLPPFSSCYTSNLHAGLIARAAA